MRMLLITASFTVALATPAHARMPNGLSDALQGVAQADIEPIKKDKYKWKGNGCKYEFKADHKGVKEKYKCK